MKVTCPKCAKELRATQDLRGKRVACPRCKESFRVASREEPSATNTQRPPPSLNRPAQAAKFIAAETAETAVQLGSDGRLPELVFEDQSAERETHKSQSEDSNPLLLIGILCFSITLSLIMLVFDPQPPQSGSAAKSRARNEIARTYIGTGPRLRPHEKRLRQALQAFHRGDHEAERRLYREVLHMLRDESHRGVMGLTGPRRAAAPPNDHHLEQQLATLLSRD